MKDEIARFMRKQYKSRKSEELRLFSLRACVSKSLDLFLFGNFGVALVKSLHHFVGHVIF